MGYAVIARLDDDSETKGMGYSLEEAFARIMQLSGCHHTMYRINSEMTLSITPRDGSRWMNGTLGEFKSKLANDHEARRDIYARFLKFGFGDYRIIRDEDWDAVLERRKVSDVR